MKQPKRMQVMVGILLVLTVFAAVYLTRAGQTEAKPPPSAPGYYTGPMKNKSGKEEYSTEDNKIVPKPADAGSSSAPESTGGKGEE